MSRVMGPKNIPVRTLLTLEVKISTSQDAPTLRQQKSKPRAYENEETTTTKSLSPELTATKKEIQEALTLRTSNEETTIMNKETPDREQIIIEEIATLANSTYHTSMTTSPYVPLGSLGHSHEAQKTKHASSRNQIDLFHISTVQEQDNMSKPVTTQRLPSHGSTSNEDRGGGYAIPNIGVSATPKNTTTKISRPSSGPDPVLTNTLNMDQIQAMLDKTARDIIDDLAKQTDAVKNLKIQFKVKSKNAKETEDPEKSKGQNELPVKSQKTKVNDKPDKTTGATIKDKPEKTTETTVNNEPEKTTGQTKQIKT